jgi:hypothetical protein
MNSPGWRMDGVRMRSAECGLGPPSLRYGCDKAGDFRRFPIISPISIISAKNHMRYHIRFGIKIKGITQSTRFTDEFFKNPLVRFSSSTKVPIVPIISIQVSGFESRESGQFKQMFVVDDQLCMIGKLQGSTRTSRLRQTKACQGTRRIGCYSQLFTGQQLSEGRCSMSLVVDIDKVRGIG